MPSYRKDCSTENSLGNAVREAPMSSFLEALRVPKPQILTQGEARYLLTFWLIESLKILLRDGMSSMLLGLGEVSLT